MCALAFRIRRRPVLDPTTHQKHKRVDLTATRHSQASRLRAPRSPFERTRRGSLRTSGDLLRLPRRLNPITREQVRRTRPMHHPNVPASAPEEARVNCRRGRVGISVHTGYKCGKCQVLHNKQEAGPHDTPQGPHDMLQGRVTCAPRGAGRPSHTSPKLGALGTLTRSLWGRSSEMADEGRAKQSNRVRRVRGCQ